jgi:hypothetical protein
VAGAQVLAAAIKILIYRLAHSGDNPDSGCMRKASISPPLKQGTIILTKTLNRPEIRRVELAPQ